VTLLTDLYCMTLIHDLGRCRVLILTIFSCSNEAAEVIGLNEMGDAGSGGDGGCRIWWGCGMQG